MSRPVGPYLMLLATVSLWAFNFTVTRYVLTHGFQPLAYSTVRFMTAGVLFVGLTYGLERTLEVKRRDVPLLLGAGAVGIWVNQITFVYALKFTTASTAALVMGTLPIFTALIAWGARLEALSRRFVIAGSVSFLGVGLVAAGSSSGLSANLRGIGLMLVTAATWAVFTVAIAPLMQRYSPFRISAFVLTAGAVLLGITGSAQVLSQDFSLEPLVWAGLTFSVLGPLLLTNLLWFTAISRVGPSRAALVANLQPFLAAIFALVLLSEEMTVVQVLGGLAIGFGIILARRRVPPVPPAE